MSTPSNRWNRAIMLLDMDAFFASIEQRDRPTLRGRPVAITPRMEGGCVIAVSYEARGWGVKVGMPIREAIKRCPNVTLLPANPSRYSAVSQSIMQALGRVTPDVEVCSIDEAFLDVTACQRLWGAPDVIAERVRRWVERCSRLPVSCGVSGDKTTAKYLASQHKPQGLGVVPPWESAAYLANVPVEQLCGVGEGLRRFLARYGVFRCGDMKRLPVSVLTRRFGHGGYRLWWMCQGNDPSPVRPNVAPRKSLRHSKVLPPNTSVRATIEAVWQHLCDRLCGRLRRLGQRVTQLNVAWRGPSGQATYRCDLRQPTHRTLAIFDAVQTVFRARWSGEVVRWVAICACDPSPCRQHTVWDNSDNDHTDALGTAMDALRAQFGPDALVFGQQTVVRSRVQVIPPAWRPGDNPPQEVLR